MAVDDSYTKALLHMNGTDTSNTFTDESGKTWTAAADAQIDTAQSVFGGASGLFDGTGDYVDTPDHADFDVGAGDFTIDCWIKRNSSGAWNRICGQVDSTPTYSTLSWFLQINDTDHLTGGIYTGTTAKEATATGTIADTNWHHVALVRYGNTITLYKNGVADGTADVTGVTANNSAYKPTVGRLGEYTLTTFNGWIDEFRFSKGIARWTANFEVPTAEYRPGGGLMLFSS